MGFSFEDSLYQIIMLLFMILPIIFFIVIIIFIVRLIRRTEQRAEERLQIEKETVTYQKQQMDLIEELNGRLTKIESILKEVD